MKKRNKHLILCWHGLSVLYDVPPNVTALPTTLCHHAECMFRAREFKSIKQVIEWVETVRQPRWNKHIKIWKFHINLTKYD